jgi:hypothetical protein
MWHFILGLIIIALGVLIVMKSEWLLSNFGGISWFEEHMHSEGGSRLGYKLIGLVLIFFGILIFTNMINGFMLWILSPLMKYNQPMPT